MLDFLRRGRKGKPVEAVLPSPHAYSSYGYPADTSGYHSPRAADLTVGDYANGIPNIKLGAMFGSLMRQMIWVLPLLFVGIIAAWILTKDFKRTYTGEGTLMVQLGDEYVYQPVGGTQTQSSLMQTPDTITLNEVAIIKNAEVMDRVIGEIASGPGGLAAFDRDLAAKMSRHSIGSTSYQLAYMELRKKMDKNFSVEARPKSSVIDLSFKHENPQFAVSTLNALMDAYMDYRRTIFVEGAGEAITERRQDTEDQLRANEKRMASFLAGNKISDFESEQTGASRRTENLKAELNGLQAQIVETERSLASVEDQLRQTSETINLYIDDRASNRVAQAELELKQLLAKYLPNSDPVRQKQLEIDQLRAFQQTNNGQAAGGRRVGPNPEYQALLRSRNTMQASANSLREREVTVQRQLANADSKVRRMTALMPGYADILRERDTLNNRLRTYLNKEQEAIINQQQSETASENVKVISAATYPVKGRNMRMLAFAGASAAWGLSLFMLALFFVFIDPKLYAVAPGASMGTSYGTGLLDRRQAQVYHDPIPEGIQPSQPPLSRAVGPQEYVPTEPSVEETMQPSWDQQGYGFGQEQYMRPTADGTFAAPFPSQPAETPGEPVTVSHNPYL